MKAKRLARTLTLWLAAGGLIAAGAVLLKLPERFSPPPSTSYITAMADRGDIRRIVNATGKMNPVATVLVGSQVTGKISEIFADFNSPVTQGQVIAQIDPALFEAQLARNLAALDGAGAEVEKTERDWKRQEELFAKNVIPQSEADHYKFLYLKAVAERNKAKAEVDLAQANLNYATIRSPVDGIVISRDVDVGQTVAASLQAPTLFTIARDLKRMRINVSVDEADIGQIQTGQQVVFTVDTHPQTYFSGTVAQIRNAPVVIQNVVHYDVIVDVENEDLKLKPGMTAHVYIVTASKSDTLRVPNAALRFIPEGIEPVPAPPRTPMLPGLSTAAQDEATVWEPRGGKPRQRKIKIGMSDEFFTEVVEGLKEGEPLILGEKIRPSKRLKKRSPLFK